MRLDPYPLDARNPGGSRCDHGGIGAVANNSQRQGRADFLPRRDKGRNALLGAEAADKQCEALTGSRERRLGLGEIWFYEQFMLGNARSRVQAPREFAERNV